MGEADQFTSSNPDIAKMTQSGGTDGVAGNYFWREVCECLMR
jgi:hypothetical protein